MTQAEVSGVDNPYRFSTKEWDEKSGLYYFGARYYSPKIGRWTQRDPAGGEDGLNLFFAASSGFCGGGPFTTSSMRPFAATFSAVSSHSCS